MSAIALMALSGVIVGSSVAFFTWKAQRAARTFLLAELVWLLALALVAVLPAHGAQTAIWVHPTINTRLIYEKVRAGASYEQALRETQPAMRRKLEADTFGCAQTMPRATSMVMCLEQRGWLRVDSAKAMTEAFLRAWHAEVDRHDGIDPGIFADR